MCTKPLLKINTHRINPKTKQYELEWIPKTFINRGIDEIKTIYKDDLIEIPCGKCEECKENQKKEISIRALKAFENEKNIYFITLTFKDDKTAEKAEENPKQFLIENLKIDKNTKYLASFEHGEKTKRAHYHIICQINDTTEIYQQTWKRWRHGFSMVEIATPETFFYTANYTTKKKFNTDKILFSRSLGKSEFLTELERKPNIEYYFYKGRKYALPRYFKKLKEKYQKITLEEKEKRRIKKAQISQKIENNKRAKNDLLKADKIAYNKYKESTRKEGKTRNLYD